jgi:hypothetical protein
MNFKFSRDLNAGEVQLLCYHFETHEIGRLQKLASNLGMAQAYEQKKNALCKFLLKTLNLPESLRHALAKDPYTCFSMRLKFASFITSSNFDQKKKQIIAEAAPDIKKLLQVAKYHEELKIQVRSPTYYLSNSDILRLGQSFGVLVVLVYEDYGFDSNQLVVGDPRETNDVLISLGGPDNAMAILVYQLESSSHYQLFAKTNGEPITRKEKWTTVFKYMSLPEKIRTSIDTQFEIISERGQQAPFYVNKKQKRVAKAD